MSIRAPRKQYLWVWLLWLACFYGVWCFLVFAQDRWEVVKAHWPIALAMTMGSYVAGSTPMGGGTVGFPILVLLFGMPASLGRDFSFAVQSIGMVSASIFILSRRQPLAWSMLNGQWPARWWARRWGFFFLRRSYRTCGSKSFSPWFGAALASFIFTGLARSPPTKG